MAGHENFYPRKEIVLTFFHCSRPDRILEAGQLARRPPHEQNSGFRAWILKIDIRVGWFLDGFMLRIRRIMVAMRFNVLQNYEYDNSVLSSSHTSLNSPNPTVSSLKNEFVAMVRDVLVFQQTKYEYNLEYL